MRSSKPSGTAGTTVKFFSAANAVTEAARLARSSTSGAVVPGTDIPSQGRGPAGPPGQMTGHRRGWFDLTHTEWLIRLNAAAAISELATVLLERD